MEEKVECKHCGKKFDFKEALEQHTNAKHMQTTEVAKQPDSTSIKLKKRQLMILVFVVLGIAGLGYGIYQVYSSPYANIGPFGSTHIHADFLVYINNNPITFGAKYFVKDSRVHIEHGSGAGTVMHMHSTSTPLGLFFNSLGMKFTNECFTLDNGKSYCNDGFNSLKLYVKHKDGNWELNNEFDRYAFQALDKILISYGSDDADAIKSQQDSVTNFAKDISGRSVPLVG